MRKAKYFHVVLVAGLLVVLFSPASAEVRLPALFGDNMVLQRDVKVPVWGAAEPGERVTVRFVGRKVSTTADKKGNWMVRLKPLVAVRGPADMTVSGTNTIKIRNVLVGEVWLCSGQSNMAWTVRQSADARKEIANADYLQIRLFRARRAMSDTPQRDVQANWAVCSPKTVGGFSAVGYHFGRDIHKALNVPVGLIDSTWGGTPIEAWISAPALKAEPEFKVKANYWKQRMESYDLQVAREEHNKRLAEWKIKSAEAEAAGEDPPYKPRFLHLHDHPNRPARIYNGMIAPLIPCAIKGVIWYQGESNTGCAYLYRTLFPALIRDWRKRWGQGDFPFLYVQLAGCRKPQTRPAENSRWAELREAQLMTLSLPMTAMASSVDIGDAGLHPRNKKVVGRRLALAARAVAYGKKIVYSGPIYQSMKVEAGKVRLKFKHVGGGLAAKGGGLLKGFAITGPDKKFVWANVKIDGDTVVVWSDDVAGPIAVRYAWANYPIGNLCNAEGLPASPFRTDDWPGVTINAGR